jgi:CheY-like chemotaxis protein
MLLEVCGHDATVRHDAVACIELLESLRPEIVFLDLSMPGLDGYELCRHIRSKPWGHQPFIFAMTGWMHVEPDALAAGFDACLLKPCSLEHFELLLANPAAHSSRVLDERRGPAAVVPNQTDQVEEA